MHKLQLRHIANDHDYQACFLVMRELRPHLSSAEAFATQVRRQAEHGYRLLAAWQDDKVVGLAGYRIVENLLYGRFLYVDDLVTTAEARSTGLGEQLINALRGEAKKQACAHVVLDTALSNSLGQRFYFRQGLLAVGMHFRQAV